jgi:hypothetical protein
MNSSRRTNWLWWWIAAYIALAGGVVGGMFWMRQAVLSEFATEEASANWRAWREDVRQQQTNPGPVERKVPKSVEPPALVLMRNYFVVSLVGAVFFTSLLYWVMAWFISGALATGEPDRKS